MEISPCHGSGVALCALGDLDQPIYPALEHGVAERLTIGETPGGPCRPRPGPRGHLVERRLQAARAEHLVRRVEDPVALLTGTGAQAPENRPPNGMYPAFR
jgi:hypothetical protein